MKTKKTKKILKEHIYKGDDNPRNRKGQQYYVDIDNDGKFLTVENFLEAFDNLPPKAYKIPLMNVGPGGKIFGQVGGIEVVNDGKHRYVALTLTPYKHLTTDYSLPNTPKTPISFDAAKAKFATLPKNYEVMIKSKNFYGYSTEANNVILVHVERIELSESDGFFIRPDTWYITIEDNKSKMLDTILMLKKRSMQNSSKKIKRNKPIVNEDLDEADFSESTSDADMINTAYSTLLYFLTGEGKKVLNDQEWMNYLFNDTQTAIQKGLFKPSFEDKLRIRKFQEAMNPVESEDEDGEEEEED